jgi:hypothetical protein
MQTAAVREGRKPGRPRKYGQGRINATVRFTPERYAALKAKADRQGRSVSEEVEQRINRTFAEDRTHDIKRDLDELYQLISARWEVISARWEELFGQATGRIAELEKERVLSEHSLAQIVEGAVARALMGGNG